MKKNSILEPNPAKKVFQNVDRVRDKSKELEHDFHYTFSKTIDKIKAKVP